MATHYSGMGDTSMENLEPQDVDGDSQENYQEENIIQQLTCKMEQLRQTVEDKVMGCHTPVGIKAKSINNHTVPSFRTH